MSKKTSTIAQKSKKSTASKTAKSVVNKTKVNKPKAVSGRLNKDKMSKEKEIVSKVKEIISKNSAKGNAEKEAKKPEMSRRGYLKLAHYV